jgi:FtsP/CotA-like multicopper oxidase with cupredoxin domain
MTYFLAERRFLKTTAAVLLFLLVVGILRSLSGCGGGSTGSPTPSTNGFPQPQVRIASDGKLNTSLHAEIASNSVLNAATGDTDVIEGPTFEGTIPGPTLILNPGDTLNVSVVNNLPANPPVTRAGAFPHAPYTINLHTHGLEVSPLGNSDNVFRAMEPGTTNQVTVDIPASHHSGTFWYHPHDHGAVGFDIMGGMAGMLIIKGGPGTIDTMPEVKAAKQIVMDFQVLHTTTSGQVVYVNPTAAQMGSTTPQLADGLWSAYITSNTYFTTNGVTAPVLHMRPGEVQRWRMLNAAAGETLLVALQGHPLNVIANDGITVPNTVVVPVGTPYTMGAGQRVDVLVQAGSPGTYLLQALDPGVTLASVTPQGIDPQLRPAHTSGDFPAITYPVTLATISVSGTPESMKLPSGPLPPPSGLPSISTMVNTTPNFVRNIDFDLCGAQANMSQAAQRLPTCGWYFSQYDAAYWGGLPFLSLNLFRDADDTGQVNPVCLTTPLSPACVNTPLINFAKGGLFDPNTPLFNNMFAGNYEKWTVVNRSFSDHAFHIHQNPFLVTAVNGISLPVPEWHDTIIVPAAFPQPPPAITAPSVTFGSITFRTHFDPITVGQLVTHCHLVQHEDIGMMQRIDILPAP